MEKPVELNPIRLLAKHLVALFCAWLLLPSVTMAAVPPLTSMRAIALPAEVLLSWDEWPDAAFYGVYRANLDRRWVPIAKNVLVPRYRDTDFETLPCYYQVAAFNAAGDLIAFSELLESTLSPLLAGPIGVNPRPVSDTGFAVEWNLGLGLAGDGLLEVGASPTNYEWAASITNFAMRQEFVLTNLQPNTTYFYRITSASPDGTGFSYWNSFVTRPFVETPAYISIPTLDGSQAIVTTDEDAPLQIIFTATNLSGSDISYAVINRPSDGGTLVGTLPNIVFLPKPEGENSDIFQVTATDGAATNATIVEVRVRPIHDSPIAYDQSFTIYEDTGIKIPLLARSTDADPATLSYIIQDRPTNGVLTKALYDPPSYMQYIPNTNFNGIDHFTFVATDGLTTGNVATVRIRVLPSPDPPIALPQTLNVFRGAATNFTLAISDVDNDPLMLSVLSGPASGRLSINRTNPFPPIQATYTPIGVSTNNTDSFTYLVQGNNAFYVTATVTINLVPPYYPPIAYGASFNTAWGEPVEVPLSAMAPSGGALDYLILGQVAHGVLSGTSPALTYTPFPGFYGVDGFMFQVGDGLSLSAPVTNLVYVWGPVSPPAPSGLGATAVSTHQIDLVWSDNSWNEDGFEIERSEDSVHWKLVGTAGKNATGYSSIKLGGNNTYYYRVRATNSFGASDYSNVASARTWK